MRITIELEPDSPVLKRLKDWSKWKGCSLGEATFYVLSNYAEDALPTEEEDAEFEASYAKAQAAIEAQQSLENCRPSVRRGD